MASRKRGLGRGLDALLKQPAPAPVPEPEPAAAPAPPAAVVQPVAAVATAPVAEEGQLRVLPVDLIQRGKYQPRKDMHQESLQDLADSIRAQGVVQPIVVRGIGEGRYEIIAGERRWRAAQLAGLQEIPAVVREVSDRSAIAMALIENIQREELNPLEEARALARLIEEFEMTHQQAAEAIGRSRTAVSNLLRLLDLNDDVKALVEAGRLEMGHARALLGLMGAAQSEAAREVAARGLSVRETERLVRRRQQAPRRRPAATPRTDPNISRLEQDLAERLGALVRVEHRRGGRGRLVIPYNSLEELDGIIDKIGATDSQRG